MELFLQSWQPLMADWLALTVANPAYATTIAGIVWLLTAMLGAIRASGLKKIIARKEQLGQQLQQTLDDTNGQLQSTRQSLATSQEQMAQRNKQIADVIQLLSTSFDMGERPIAVTEDTQAEALWEQHGRAVNQLIASLRAESQAKTAWQNDCQSEAAKRAALEAQVVPLQAKLGEHSGQIEALVTKQNGYVSYIGELQQKLTEQNELYQQLEQQTEASLEHFAQCHETDTQHLEELQQQLAQYKTQNDQLQETLAAKEGEITHWQDQAKALLVNTLPVAGYDKAAELATHNNEAESLQEPIAPVLPDYNAETPPAEELFVPTTTDIVAALPSEPPVEKSAEQDPEHSPLGFMKNLFGKNKPVTVEEVETVASVEPKPEQEPEAVVTDVEAVALPEVQATAEHNPVGFMKNLFGKNKTAPIEETEEVVAIKHSEPDTLLPHTADSAEYPASSDPLGFMKNIFKNKQPVEPELPLAIVEQRSEPEIAEPVADNQAFGFMKKLFAKPEPEPISLEQEPEPPIVPEETPAKPADQLKGFYRLFSMKNKTSNEEA